LIIVSIITEALREANSLREMIKILLTGVTANQGYGFNRAFFFLFNEEKKILEGFEATGPTSNENAAQTWQELSNTPFSQIIKASIENDSNTQLRKDIENLELSISDSDILYNEIYLNNNTFFFESNNCYDNILKIISENIDSNYFAIVPIYTKFNFLGILIIDNKFSSKPITSIDIKLLETFAFSTAQTIELMNLYNNLQEQINVIEEKNDILKQQQEKLLELSRLATIGETTSMIAHEIKNPLTIIGGFSKKIMEYQSHDNFEINKYAELIYKESMRLQQMLNDFLSSSKKHDLNMENKSLSSLIKEIIFFYKIETTKKSIKLKYIEEERISNFFFDYDKIKQVIINLLNNSIEAVPTGGTIEIKTSFADKKTVLMTIKDNGPGIPAESQSQIFNLFVSEKESGFGVGLPVVKKIIEWHKGNLQFKSSPEGTIFEIYLPLKL